MALGDGVPARAAWRGGCGCIELTTSGAGGLDGQTLGRIAFSRFLELPLRSLDRLIAGLEAGATYRSLAPWVQAGTLAAARLHPDAGTPLAPGSRLLGEVRLSAAGTPGFLFSRAAFAREYRIDEPALADWHARHGLSAAQRQLLYKLHLVNSRNRLNWGLLQAVLQAQAAYFDAGDPLALAALPQTRMVALIAAQGGAAPVQPDAGRLSRLIRAASFRSVDGKLWPLGLLFPKPRQLHGYQLRHLIEQEKALFREGRIERAQSDELLAQRMQACFGSPISRRSVAQVRQQLGIPDGRRRGEIRYHAIATQAFSPLFPMTPQGISHFIPAHSGVYEIRCALPSEPGARAGVVYIGSSQDLKKRLYEHLSGNSGNVHLSNFLSGGGAKVRFWVVRENWRQAERQLYLAFCESFGVPPPCNRMSP